MHGDPQLLRTEAVAGRPGGPHPPCHIAPVPTSGESLWSCPLPCSTANSGIASISRRKRANASTELAANTGESRMSLQFVGCLGYTVQTQHTGATSGLDCDRQAVNEEKVWHDEK
jgi:hypothetical protein